MWKSYVLGLAVCLASARANAQAPAQTAPPTETSKRLELHAFVDAYFAYNANQPNGRVNFLPGTGTTAKRHHELGLNLAALDVVAAPKPVGGRLTLNVGTATNILHAGEPTGVGVGPDVFQFIYNAYVSFAPPAMSGLVVDAGVFPCHVGYEAFFSKDNWNYTRSWLGELSPYYVAGLRGSYALSERWSVQLHLINGWQSIGDVNLAKTLGSQVAYNSDLLSLSLNGMFGPELPNDNRSWRIFSDVVLVIRPTSWLHVGASADYARQSRPDGDAAVWHAAAGYLRLIPLTWLALAARVEYFADPHAGISGASQTLSEGTLTLEWRPDPAVIVKAEVRYDQSTAATFNDYGTQPDGSPNTTDNQLLAVLGTVVTF